MIMKYTLEDQTVVDIAFSDDKNYMRINEICKRFNKRPNDWTTNAGTIAYMDALITDLNDRSDNSGNAISSRIELLQTKQGGVSQGTWIHPDLVVEFARWLNPKFAVWCDKIIRSILLGTHEVVPKQLVIPGKAELLRAMADQVEATEAALLVVAEQKVVIEVNQPKVEYANAVASADGSTSVRLWVKTFNKPNADKNPIKEGEVFKWLVDNNYLYRDNSKKLHARALPKNDGVWESVPGNNVYGEGKSKAYKILKITSYGQTKLLPKLMKDLRPKSVV